MSQDISKRQTTTKTVEARVGGLETRGVSGTKLLFYSSSCFFIGLKPSTICHFCRCVQVFLFFPLLLIVFISFIQGWERLYPTVYTRNEVRLDMASSFREVLMPVLFTPSLACISYGKPCLCSAWTCDDISISEEDMGSIMGSTGRAECEVSRNGSPI
jgi:hypothetical protein